MNDVARLIPAVLVVVLLLHIRLHYHLTPQALNWVLRATVYPSLSTVPATPRVLQQLHRLEALHGDWALRWRMQNRPSPHVRPFIHERLCGQWVWQGRPKPTRGTVLYIHGGAFVLGSASQYWMLTSRLAALLPGWRVLALDYRKAPTHPFPAALDDCVSAYRHLVRAKAHVILMGDSAGGNLAFATALHCLQQGLPAPLGVVGLAPWLDLGLAVHETISRAKATADPMLPAHRKDEAVLLYLKGTNCDQAGPPTVLPKIHNAGLPSFGGADPCHPLVSPLRAANADLVCFPPVCIHVGTRDFLLQDATTLTKRLRACNPQAVVDLRVWDGLPHVFQLFAPLVPEATDSLGEIAQFVRMSLQFQCREKKTTTEVYHAA